MNVLITAGGTTERIDKVRGISNFSTGKLGAKIAEAFASNLGVGTVYYVHSQDAQMPKFKEKIRTEEFSDVASLQRSTTELLRKHDIDAVIHCAAVSDYTVSKVLDPNGKRLPRNAKIGSNMAELTVMLKPTPKVISQFHQISPKTKIIGFKLLSDVSNKELLAAASQLLVDNQCEYVLANRLEDIDKKNHTAQLVGKDGVIAAYNTKDDIARGLVEALGLETIRHKHTIRHNF
ncbi:phosphopantothenate--cysteine ligase [Clostridia bacterium]|nr:phosphopantothenate--cysteine ligase [Clostridia bacterium]